MKLKNIYLLLLASAMFTACSDESDSWNTGSAIVSMGEQEIAVKESKGLFNVPVTVKGEQNGPIRVTIEVTEIGTEPAMDDVHYIVTSKTIVIPANVTIGNIEIATVDDNDINATRTFTVKIVKAEGATIAEGMTLVSLKDNDSAFYEKLQGKWKMTTSDPSKTWDVSIVGYEEGESGYDKTLYITGIMGYSWTTAELLYKYDIASKKGSVEILLGTLFAENVNFGADGFNDIYLGTVNGNNMVFEGSIPGTWNDDLTKITFESKNTLWGFLAPTGTTDFSGYSWFSKLSGITLTKK